MKKYRCPICGYLNRWKFMVVGHMERVHGEWHMKPEEIGE